MKRFRIMWLCLVAVFAISVAAAASASAASSGVWAWGWDYGGELGDGTNTGPSCGQPPAPCSKTPVAVSGLSAVTAISAGMPFSLALLGNGTVMAWGDNTLGELGDGTSTGPETCYASAPPCSKTPVAVSGLSAVTAISAGRQHSLALLSNGTVSAWGRNDSGQLGNGTTTDSDVPVTVKGLSGVTAISAGGGHSRELRR